MDFIFIFYLYLPKKAWSFQLLPTADDWEGCEQAYDSNVVVELAIVNFLSPLHSDSHFY